MKNKLFHIVMFSILLGTIAFVGAGPGPGQTTARDLQLTLSQADRALMAAHNFTLVGFSQIRCDVSPSGTCEVYLLYRERGVNKKQTLVFPHGNGLSTNSVTTLQDLRDERIQGYLNYRFVTWREEDARAAELQAQNDERDGNVPVGPGAITIR